LGQRFAEKGYQNPKPFISVLGIPMIEWVVRNVKPSTIRSRFTFIRNELHRSYEPEKILKAIAPDCRIIYVPGTTEGAACTLLHASSILETDNPLLIANSDQYVETSIDAFIEDALARNADGSIMTFNASDKKWSFARVDSNGRVLEVAEKKPIISHATVGIYYFKHARDFLHGAHAMIKKDIRTNGEFYVCPVYNESIRSGLQIRIFPIPEEAMNGLGTPEDLERFLSKTQISREKSPPRSIAA
jgi:NDP-sugar pyrophosphorylase family protein